MKRYEYHSLKSFNTFHVEYMAKQLIVLETLGDLQNLIQSGELKGERIMVLGGGSNILFTKDFDGLILHPQFRGKKVLEENEEFVRLRVGAGESWADLVKYTVENSWNGIENLALIPGLVGAAPIQNIGAYGVELKDVFDHLRAINLRNGELVEFSNDACQFDYRSSIFKTALKGQFLIYDVCLRLLKNDPVNISYRALKEFFKEKVESDLTPRNVFEAVVEIRNNKLPDPDEIGNAGSFFKNPLVSREKYEEIQKEFPDVIGFVQDNKKVKLAAGWLIEKAGFKGLRKGDAGVHEMQALVLVNYGKATGKEIYEFSEEVKATVTELFDVELEAEVNIV